MINLHKLRDAIEHFDNTIEQLVMQNYDVIDIRKLGSSYNQIKTALAHYMLILEKQDEQS